MRIRSRGGRYRPTGDKKSWGIPLSGIEHGIHALLGRVTRRLDHSHTLIELPLPLPGACGK